MLTPHAGTRSETDRFAEWPDKLKDMRAKFGIIARIRRAELGNFGDCRTVGEGVSEMRIRVGADYRVCSMQDCGHIYLLLIGGDKSPQQGDIAAAIDMAKERRASR